MRIKVVRNTHNYPIWVKNKEHEVRKITHSSKVSYYVIGTPHGNDYSIYLHNCDVVPEYEVILDRDLFEL